MTERVLRLVLPTAADTRELGRRIGGLVRAGDLIVLAGPLGAGKTVFVQGLGAGLGVPDQIASPTFVIARVHERGRVPLVHVDAYRLGSLGEIDELDLDVSAERAVTAVEWGAGRVEQLADSWLTVTLSRGGAPAGDDPVTGPDGTVDEQRLAELNGYGGDWPQRLAALLADHRD